MPSSRRSSQPGDQTQVSWQEYWSRLSFPSPGDLPDPRLLRLLHQQVGSLPLAPPQPTHVSSNQPLHSAWWFRYTCSSMIWTQQPGEAASTTAPASQRTHEDLLEATPPEAGGWERNSGVTSSPALPATPCSTPEAGGQLEAGQGLKQRAPSWGPQPSDLGELPFSDLCRRENPPTQPEPSHEMTPTSHRMYQRGVGTGSLENTGAGHSRVLGVRSDSCFSQTRTSPSQGDPGHLITAHRHWLSPLQRLSCAESSWDRSRGLHLSPQLPVKLVGAETQ